MRTALGFHVRHSVIVLATGLLLLGGCEAIFTYSPFSGLQRDPSALSPEQRLTYAEDALASGDLAAMQKALDAIKNDTSTDAVYTSAKLEVELSGLPTLGVKIDDTSSLDSVVGSAQSVDDFLTAHPGLKPEMVIDAGQRLLSVEGDTTLSVTDRVVGAMGLALAASADTSPPYDLTKVDLSVAIQFLAPVATPGSVAEDLYQYLGRQ